VTNKLTSSAFLNCCFAAVDTIYIQQSDKVTTVDSHALGKAEGRAEQVFENHLIGAVGGKENLTEKPVLDFSPNFDTEVLTINCSYGVLKFSTELHLADYNIDLVDTPLVLGPDTRIG